MSNVIRTFSWSLYPQIHHTDVECHMTVNNTYIYCQSHESSLVTEPCWTSFSFDNVWSGSPRRRQEQCDFINSWQQGKSIRQHPRGEHGCFESTKKIILHLNKEYGGRSFINIPFLLYESTNLIEASPMGAGHPAGPLRTPACENIPPGHFVHH